MKRISADDSADSRVKVGHRQAIIHVDARSTDRAFASLPGAERRRCKPCVQGLHLMWTSEEVQQKEVK